MTYGRSSVSFAFERRNGNIRASKMNSHPVIVFVGMGFNDDLLD